MTATLYYAAFSPSTVSASTAASGYAGTNVLTPQVAKAWRSTTTGSSSITIDLGAEEYVSAVAVNHVNASSIAVYYGDAADPGASSGAGTMNTYTDGQGRRKGSLLLEQESVRYIRLVFSGTPTDGAAYWTVGAAHVFESRLPLPRDPLMGSDQRIDYPQLVQQLPNGQILRVDRGVSRMAVRLRFSGRITDDIEALMRYARATTVWLDMGLPTAQWCQWPMTHVDDGTTRQWTGYNREPLQIGLLELA